MAGTSFTNVAVPFSATPTSPTAILQVIKVGKKVGKVQLSFFNNILRDNLGNALETGIAYFQIQESDDRVNWSTIGSIASDPSTAPGYVSASVVGVKPGGQQIAHIITNKAYIQVLGASTVGGAYVKIDLFFNGLIFFGQVDLDVVGKSGFGFDGDPIDTSITVGQSPAGASGLDKQGEAIYGSSPWPR